MNYANLCKGLVIGTSDMSEIALGWSTFNGDQIAMYGLNSGIPKTTVTTMSRLYHAPHGGQGSSQALCSSGLGYGVKSQTYRPCQRMASR